MLNVETYNLMMATMSAYFGPMGKVRANLDPPPPTLPPILQLRQGYAESPGWYLIQAAEFDPAPLSVANLRVRDIYASGRIVQALLDIMASEKWLDKVDDDYHLTAAGRAILQERRAVPIQLIHKLQPLPQADLVRLEALLHRLLEASLQSTTPPGNWCLTHSRNNAPGDDASPLLKIYYYFADFNAFRDDAHMAAFQPQEAEGYIWEAFTFVADGTADTAARLFEQLAYRGYSREEFAQALTHLAQRGWLEERATPASYAVTPQGQKLREEVEHLTDLYFYQPWSVLTEAEIDEVHTLLAQLRDGLHTLS